MFGDTSLGVCVYGGMDADNPNPNLNPDPTPTPDQPRPSTLTPTLTPHTCISGSYACAKCVMSELSSELLSDGFGDGGVGVGVGMRVCHMSVLSPAHTDRVGVWVYRRMRVYAGVGV